MPTSLAGIAERDQLLAQQHQAHLRTVGLELGREAGRDPELPHELSHRSRASDAGEKLVLGCVTMPDLLFCYSRRTPALAMFRNEAASAGLAASASAIGASRKLFGG